MPVQHEQQQQQGPLNQVCSPLLAVSQAEEEEEAEEAEDVSGFSILSTSSIPRQPVFSSSLNPDPSRPVPPLSFSNPSHQQSRDSPSLHTTSTTTSSSTLPILAPRPQPSHLPSSSLSTTSPNPLVSHSLIARPSSVASFSSSTSSSHHYHHPHRSKPPPALAQSGLGKAGLAKAVVSSAEGGGEPAGGSGEGER
jgi:hypothetical protein